MKSRDPQLSKASQIFKIEFVDMEINEFKDSEHGFSCFHQNQTIFGFGQFKSTYLHDRECDFDNLKRFEKLRISIFQNIKNY